ncbi:MAG: binding-protein-dependent transport system inner rane component [Hyphomicrobiales bacterium]|nr:binding-protein-dependent transport system inner rane component [Hyphomicrobiales bacterium]
MSDAALPAAVPARKRLGLSDEALARIVCGLAILAVWEGAMRLWAPPFIARPSGIAVAFWPTITSAAFLEAAGATLGAMAQGLAIAVVAGTVIGLAIGRSWIADRALHYYVNGLFAMPMVAILPLLTLWFGYTSGARLATVVFASIFAIIINVSDGARSVPREYIEVSRAYRASGFSRLMEVVLPASVPYLLAGLRLAAGRALIGAVVAEFFAALNGLGYFILFNTRTFKHNEAFVAVLCLACFGVAVELMMNGATRRYLPWYRREDRGA